MIRRVVFLVLCIALLSHGLANAGQKNVQVTVKSIDAQSFSAQIGWNERFADIYEKLWIDIGKWFESHPRAKFVKTAGQVIGSDGQDLTYIFKNYQYVDLNDVRLNVRGTSITIVVIYKE